MAGGWSDVLMFEVVGIPKPQPRMRHFVRQAKGQAVARGYTPGTADDWKARVCHEAARVRPSVPLDGPLRVSMTLHLPRPKRLCRRCDPDGSVWAPGGPDVDNLAKAVLDAMTQVGVWRDDSCVVMLTVAKRYHAKGGRARAHVLVYEWEEAIGN